MISCLALTVTSCETTKLSPEFMIPSLPISKPDRPILESIPRDTTEVIKAFTVNLSRMNSYIEQLEMYIQFQENYHEAVFRIIFSGESLDKVEYD